MPRFFPLLVVACGVLAGLCVPPAEARRVALVIGNADYRIGPLANPLNDAAAIAAVFERQLKFDKVILKRNLGFSEFRAALAELAREAVGADLGVVYFAGHGIEVAGRNYLIPVDAKLGRAGAVDLEAIPLDTVLGQLDGVRKLKLVILDACRNNPFPVAGAKRSVSRGLARIEPEGHTLIAYAAKDGTTAEDGRGRHSPFTAALLKRIATPGLEVRRLFGYVSDDVLAATNRAQEPYVYGRLGGAEIFLHPHAPVGQVPAPAAPVVPQSSQAALEWSRVDRTSIAELETFERRHGGSPEAEYARARLRELRKQQIAVAVPPQPPASPVATGPEPRQLYEQAYAYLLRKDYGAAGQSFETFVKRHPGHALAGNAQYWLGETFYVRGQYRPAASAFLKGYRDFGKSSKAPESLLKLAMSLHRLGQKDAACSSYRELAMKFPNPPAHVRSLAQLERQRSGC